MSLDTGTKQMNMHINLIITQLPSNQSGSHCCAKMDINMGEGRGSAALQDDNAGTSLASSSTKIPSPSQAKVISSMNKRQQAAQKARMVAVCVWDE
jgi:hypothetical protein